MTVEESAKVLAVIGAGYPQFVFTVETAGAWAKMFEQDPIEVVLGAYHYLVRSGELKNPAFPPSMGEIAAKIAEWKKPKYDAAEVVWLKGPGEGWSDIAQEAWRLWGGQSRWGRLPDLRADGSSSANMTMNLAKKQFIEVYQSLLEKAVDARMFVTMNDGDQFRAIEGAQKLLKGVE